MKLFNFIFIFTIFFGLFSCRDSSDEIIGEWKSSNSRNKIGKTTITFLSGNIYSIKYTSNTNVEIQTDGSWKYDQKSNRIFLEEFVSKSKNEFRILLLNKDSLLWQSVESDKVENFSPELFLKM